MSHKLLLCFVSYHRFQCEDFNKKPKLLNREKKNKKPRKQKERHSGARVSKAQIPVTQPTAHCQSKLRQYLLYGRA